MMNISNYFCYIAARGQGKSFIVAIFCCVRCILYPGTKICISSGTKNQALQIISKKIQLELMPNSENLRKEIKKVTVTSGQAIVEFHNTSYIEVVVANDNARGGRANIFIFDEFRQIDIDVLNDVLKKYLASEREPEFLKTEKYKHLPKQEKRKYLDRNKQIYLSSAFFKDHWSYKEVQSICRNMLDDTKRYFVCGLPYELSIKEGMLNEDSVKDEMSNANFSSIKWSMEMECLWFGDVDGAFFDFDNIAKNRKIKYAMLPDSVSSKLANTSELKIPQKVPREIRILSADIALMSSKKNHNDATAIFVNQMLPTKANRFMNNIVYNEAMEGEPTDVQTLRIRKLFDEYECDYLVLDVKGLGIPIYDALAREIVDSETGEIYPPLSCCNNPELAERCSSKSAKKVIWAINASAKFNSDCAILLREAFRSGKIRLLESEYEAEETFSKISAYNKLNENDKLKLCEPYIGTTLLINELINLKHDETSGLVKISEKSGMRKDRYSSLSYNYWVACQLESKLSRTWREPNPNQDVLTTFLYKAPKIR